MIFASNDNYGSRRSPVAGTAGIVASSQPAATLGGIDVLSRGGTAADAAVAVAACLQVTQPCSTGLGGDCFCLYYDNRTKTVSALNGSGRSPAALTPDLVRSRGFDREIPDFHALTVTVPGAPAGWEDLLARFGALSRGDVVEPAIRLARDGFCVSPMTTLWWAAGAGHQLSKTRHGHELLVDGRAPRTGERIRLPALARSLTEFAENGAEPFYRGRIARAVVEAVQEAGGVLDEDDLASHRSEWVEPISVAYRGRRVWECPPNGQGFAVLSALAVLDHVAPELLAPSHSLPGGDNAAAVNRWHYLIEAMRLGFADARELVGDPHAFPPGGADGAARYGELVARYLAPDYAKSRARLIDPARSHVPAGGVSIPAGDDTVYFSVIDRFGNGCSFINSNFMGFGTGIVPEKCGYSLQNRGKGFRLPPAPMGGNKSRVRSDAGIGPGRHPNDLAPRKRPYHTIIPGMITDPKDGSLLTVFGVMGGMMQPQGHLQVVNCLVDGRLDPQYALDYPRFQLDGGDPAGGVLFEDSVPTETIESLEARGHRTVTVGGSRRAVFGLGQIITRLEETGGPFVAGSDPRGDGCALAAIG